MAAILISNGALARAVHGEPHIRPHRIGDLGWSFERQAVLYHEEHRYSQVFETYVAKGLAPFLEHYEAARDGMWIAELEGGRVGCIAIMHDDERPGWAKLRWYFVEKQARGQGVGAALMTTALAFSRRAGYEGVHLWTVDDLVDARRVYERSGFRLAEQKEGCPWAAWGNEQRWELRFDL